MEGVFLESGVLLDWGCYMVGVISGREFLLRGMLLEWKVLLEGGFLPEWGCS